MTARELAQLLPYIITGVFGVALVLFVIAFQQVRLSRNGENWQIRRRAGQWGGWLSLIAIILIVVGVAMLFYSGLAALAFPQLSQVLFNQPQDSGFYGVVLPTFTPTGSPLPTHTQTPPLVALPTLSPQPTKRSLTPILLQPAITITPTP